MQAVYNNSKNNNEIFVIPTGPLQTNSTFIVNTENQEVLIIDAGHQDELSMAILDDNKLKLSSIIHTHTHFDHSAAAKSLQDKFDCKVEMHKDDEQLFNLLAEQGQRYGLNFEKPNPATGFLSEGQKVEFGDVKFDVFHTPGHTPGGICFYTEYFDAPLIVVGDTLFKGSIGRTDLPGGNHEQLINSIKTKLLNLAENTIVICGHGATTTIGDEKHSNPFLR